MEAFVLKSIAAGEDPFCGEGGDREEEEENGRGVRGLREGNETRTGSTAGVWMDYYIQVYNARYEQQGCNIDQAALSKCRPCQTNVFTG